MVTNRKGVTKMLKKSLCHNIGGCGVISFIDRNSCIMFGQNKTADTILRCWPTEVHANDKRQIPEIRQNINCPLEFVFTCIQELVLQEYASPIEP